MAVAAVSFGAYIHGTTVVYPAVAIPSLKKSNLSVGLNDTSDDDDGYNDAVLPFHITDDDISLIGESFVNFLVTLAPEKEPFLNLVCAVMVYVVYGHHQQTLTHSRGSSSQVV